MGIAFIGEASAAWSSDSTDVTHNACGWVTVGAYRAALFSYLENLIMRLAPDAGADSSPFEARTEYDRFLTVVRQSKDDLTAVGYEEFAVETFYEVGPAPVGCYFSPIVLLIGLSPVFVTVCPAVCGVH